MRQDVLITGTPFVSHVDQTSRPTLPLDFLKSAYVRYYTNNNNLIRFGIYKRMGYEYNFRPHLKKYLYKQNGAWHEAYAPNKSTLRRVTYGAIDKIIELND